MTTTTEARAPRPEEEAWSIRAWIGLGALVFGMLVALPFLVTGAYEASDETNDASIYVATARALLAGEGYSYLGEPFIVRPPGFALLITGVWSVCGESFLALNLLVSIFGVLACALLYVLCVPRLGVVLAFLVAGGLFVNDEFRTMSNQVMSDVPGLALLLGCLLLERWASRTRSWKRDLVLGLAIGLTSYVRTIQLLLVPAIVLARYFARDGVDRPWIEFLRARVIVLALAAIACVVPWSLRCAHHHPTPPVDQTFLYSYSTGMWHTRPYDPASPLLGPGEVLARVPERARQMAQGSQSRILSGPFWKLLGVTGIAGADFGRLVEVGHGFDLACAAVWLGLAGWVLVTRRRASELFVVLALGLLSVYFAFRPRLLLPIVVLVWPAVLEAVLGLFSRPAWKQAVLRGCVLAALVRAVAEGVLPANALDEPAWRHSHREQVASMIAPRLGHGNVAAPVGWHWSVYLRRPVWSLALAARRADAAGLDAVLARHGIDTVVLADFLHEDMGFLAFFQERWGAPEQVGPVRIFRRPR